MSDALERLCARHGVATAYYDIWGRRCSVPVAGQRAVLAAMGVAAEDDRAVEAALAAPDPDALRPHGLGPALVLREDGAPWHIALTGTGPGLDWEVVEENGGTRSGTVAASPLVLDALPAGYHRLRVGRRGGAGGKGGVDASGSAAAETVLIVVPSRCHLPAALEGGRRVWGPTAQIYALRSARNWGMGDFTDLAALVRAAAAAGASLVGINPLHALYPHDPERASPYAPSSRRFLDVLYIDVEAVPDYARCTPAQALVASAAFQERLRALRQAPLVDYGGVARAKFEILEHVHAAFQQDGASAAGAGRHAAFAAFRAAGGTALRRHALFEALQEHFHALDPATWGWPRWPEAYRDPGSGEVAAFAAAHAERVAYFEYLQWLAQEQLHAVAHAGASAGLVVGLYADLAVSIDQGGSDAWIGQDVYAPAASAGCPPDDFNLQGQDWGLLPLQPARLAAQAYGPFIDAVRAAMRHAGAVRIDHVMGLARLFWVPRGDVAANGAYVRYPFEAMRGIVALESVRAQCMVIGEDLGTVPDEVRHAMAEGRLLSYRVLYFSRRHDGEFMAPGDFPPDCVVTASTHDLPTVTGWWEGRDIALRDALRLFPSEPVRDRVLDERRHDRPRLLRALDQAGLRPHDAQAGEHDAPRVHAAGESDAPGHAPDLPVAAGRSLFAAVPAGLADAAQEYLARSPARLLVVQLEDIFGCPDQVNVPGTVDEHPNWRRKLPVAIEDWAADGRFDALARRLAAERGS